MYVEQTGLIISLVVQEDQVKTLVDHAVSMAMSPASPKSVRHCVLCVCVLMCFAACMCRMCVSCVLCCVLWLCAVHLSFCVSAVYLFYVHVICIVCVRVCA